MYNTIYQGFCTVPPFDTVTGNVLEHPDLDSSVYAHLSIYDCDSLSRCFQAGSGPLLDRWYRAYFPNDIDIDALADSLLATNTVCQIDIDDSGGTCIEEAFAPSDSAWQDQDHLFRLLGLDSAIDIVSQYVAPNSLSTIGFINKSNWPIQWGHPDLQNNTWLNEGEDINGNGVVDPWWSWVDSNGVSGDFDTVDNDGNGWIDDLIGVQFELETVQIAKDSGNGHETPLGGAQLAVR